MWVSIMIEDLEKETDGEMDVRRVASMVELWAGGLGLRLVALLVAKMAFSMAA